MYGRMFPKDDRPEPVSRAGALQLGGTPTLYPRGITTPAQRLASIMRKYTQSAWYDPQDESSLIVARTGIGVVATVGDPVGVMIDKSQLGGLTVDEWMSANGVTDRLDIPGKHAYAPTDASRPVLRESAGIRSISMDGVDDWMLTLGGFDLGNVWSHVGGWNVDGTGRPSAFATSSNFRGQVRYQTSTNAWSMRREDDGGVVAVTNGNELIAHIMTLEQVDATTVNGRYNAGNDILGAKVFSTVGEFRDLALFSALSTSPSSTMEGHFYGGVWLDGAMTVEDRAFIEAYVAAQSGVVI